MPLYIDSDPVLVLRKSFEVDYHHIRILRLTFIVVLTPVIDRCLTISDRVPSIVYSCVRSICTQCFDREPYTIVLSVVVDLLIRLVLMR